jgi:CheY-like chemotaxis protein
MSKPRPVILVVEDNFANQMLAQAVLELEGYVVRIASSSAEVRPSIQSQRPDLILMDIQLPGQDGLSIVRELKADPDTASIPVVALTAHAMTGDQKRILDAGCVAYIAKPFDVHQLAAQIEPFIAPKH